MILLADVESGDAGAQREPEVEDKRQVNVGSLGIAESPR